MANLKAEFHEQHDEEMNICLLESHLKMSKPHADVVSFDENVSHLSTSMNLSERNEQSFFMNKTAIELTGPCKQSRYTGLCWSDNPNCCYKYWNRELTLKCKLKCYLNP